MPEQQKEVKDEAQATPIAPGGKQTPIDSDIRTTGSGTNTDAKPTAKQESGDSDPLTEGAGNQGTEKR